MRPKNKDISPENESKKPRRICKKKLYLEIFVEEEFVLWHAGDVSAQELLRVGGNGLDPDGPE
jgi:hypothetical protein